MSVTTQVRMPIPTESQKAAARQTRAGTKFFARLAVGGGLLMAGFGVWWGVTASSGMEKAVAAGVALFGLGLVAAGGTALRRPTVAPSATETAPTASLK
ncbi:MAG: hypothetical protein AB7E52_06460 [Bdellovibrionales bacterium]